MKSNVLSILILMFALVACKQKQADATDVKNQVEEVENDLLPKNRQDLITIKNGEYTEYYPGKKLVKFRGFLDDKKQRDGKWVFFGKNGQELSVTIYQNGKRHGHSIVKYPNGSIHYVGEYDQEKRVGEWKFYDEKGNVTIKNF